MRVLIVEEALEKQTGHWVSYIGGIAAELRQMGDTVDVLVHREADEQVVREVGGTRWLRRSVWTDPRSKGTVGGFLHNWSFYRDVASFLDCNLPYDLVLALTVRVQHLLAFARLAGSARSRRAGRIVLLFLNGFSVYAGPGRPPKIPLTGAVLTFRVAIAWMRSALRSRRVLLAGQVAARCAEIEGLSGFPSLLLPQPVKLGISGREGRQAGQLVLVHPGFARHEKGSHLLLQAIIELLAERPELPARFVLQWTIPISMPDGTSVPPQPALREHPKVEIIPRNLPLEEYDALLARTDAMLLPYLANSYFARDSRAAIEASVLGMPAVFTRRTWLEEHFRQYGAGVAVDETVASIKEGILGLIESFDTLKRQAVGKMEVAARYYSVAKFRELLVQDGAPGEEAPAVAAARAPHAPVVIRSRGAAERKRLRPILLTGAPRTGKSLIAGCLCLSGRMWLLREAFSNYRGADHRSHLLPALRYTYTYIDESNEHLFADDFAAILDYPTYRVRLAKDWGAGAWEVIKCIAKIVHGFRNRSRQVLIDDPFVLLSAEWVEKRFGASVIVMIRHSCDFVAHRKLAGEGFDFRNLLEQKPLMDGPLKELSAEIESAVRWKERSFVRESALLWKALYHVVRGYRSRHPDWTFIRFTDIARDPEREVRALYQKLSLPFDEKLARRLHGYFQTYDTAESGLERRAGDGRYPFQQAYGLYKKVLTDKEVEIVRSITAPVAVDFFEDSEWL